MARAGSNGSGARQTSLFDTAKRVGDVLLAGCLLGLLWPWQAVASDPRRGVVIETSRRIGRFGVPFGMRVFGAGGPRARLLSWYPSLRNIIGGELSFLGPRPVPVEEMYPSDMACAERFTVRPGLLGLAWLRQRSRTGWDGELAADLEYVRNRGFISELGIWLRLGFALILGDWRPSPPTSDILGFTVNNVTMANAVGTIREAASGSGPRHVAFLNAHYANVAHRNPAYREALGQADLLLPDGSGVAVAGKILGTPIRENVNGTDLFPRLCQVLGRDRRSLLLIGGRPGVATAVGHWVSEHYPDVHVCGTEHGYQNDWRATLKRLSSLRPDVVLVGLGAPLQDLLIRESLWQSPGRVFISVGGLFDFYSGSIPRAPMWLRELGLEWVFRLVQEPRRMWRRYLIGNLLFLARVIGQRRQMRRSSTLAIRRSECAH